MKKNILFICAVFFLGSSFAQSGMQKVPVERTAVNNSAAITPNITPSSNSSVVPNPIWENTFDDMSDWVLENSSVPPLDWMISTDPAIIGQQITPVPSSLTPFASATASDGFFFISSDNTGGGDNDGTPVHAWATCRDTIDCSLYPYVQLTFSHSYRWWQDTRGVRVSGDGGMTWQEYEITNQAGYPNDQNTPNPEVTTYDISSVADIIRNCDLIISVDNTTAHLAAALGKPVWLLLPYNADFRWMEDITTSLWYKNVTLIRQQKENDWSNEIEIIYNSLKSSNINKNFQKV